LIWSIVIEETASVFINKPELRRIKLAEVMPPKALVVVFLVLEKASSMSMTIAPKELPVDEAPETGGRTMFALLVKLPDETLEPLPLNS
jgi:hypothetical protein